MVQDPPPSVSMAYYISVDATNVARCVIICIRFNVIVGSVFTQHYIYLYRKIDY